MDMMYLPLRILLIILDRCHPPCYLNWEILDYQWTEVAVVVLVAVTELVEVTVVEVEVAVPVSAERSMLK